MPDEPGGTPETGPPSFPGGAPRVPPPQPPPPPPAAPQAQPVGPPSYPSYPSSPSAQNGGYPPQPPGPYPAPSPGGGYGGYGGPGDPGAIPYAGWGTRLGGYLIDAVIFLPVLIVLYVAFRHTNVLDVHLMTRRHGTSTRRSVSLLAPLITGLLFLVYATVLYGGPRGQTVGMMAVGVKVVRAETHDVLGYGKALWRAFAEQFLRFLGTVTLILGVIWLLDMLFPLWDKKRQTLHDKLAKTVVLRVRPSG
jgi:uncharacterized RDD family membrane protein YckC